LNSFEGLFYSLKTALDHMKLTHGGPAMHHGEKIITGQADGLMD